MDKTAEEIQAFLRDYPDSGRDLTLLINGYRELASETLKRISESGGDTVDWMISMSWKDAALEGYGIAVLRTPLDWHNYRQRNGEQMGKTPNVAEDPRHPLYAMLWRIALALEESNRLYQRWIEQQNCWRQEELAMREKHLAESRNMQLQSLAREDELLALARQQAKSSALGRAFPPAVEMNHHIGLLRDCRDFISCYGDLDREPVSTLLNGIKHAISQCRETEPE